jgi:hypothetical protein
MNNVVKQIIMERSNESPAKFLLVEGLGPCQSSLSHHSVSSTSLGSSDSHSEPPRVECQKRTVTRDKHASAPIHKRPKLMGRPKNHWTPTRVRKLVRLYLMTRLDVCEIGSVLRADDFQPR